MRCQILVIRSHRDVGAFVIRDQLPVELIFERLPSADDDGASIWVINAYVARAFGRDLDEVDVSRKDVDLVMWAIEPKTASLKGHDRFERSLFRDWSDCPDHSDIEF